MRKIKIVMLLIVLILFSSELFAKNSATDLNITSKEDNNTLVFNTEIDNWDDGEEPNFELRKKAEEANKKAKAANKKAKAAYKKAKEKLKQVTNILLGQ